MKHPVVQQAVQLGVKGRLVLPAGVRRVLRLQEGDRLLLRLRDDGVIELVTYPTAKAGGFWGLRA
ncbi:MAG: AbrB/MazE/SpoVT family DNA-binding domain-containing protein [Thermaceae bacterium]|nr:AbrB/MazE/SpoVT family DNA-binding domain-containing protein [Thermaceae bacterium]